MLDCDDSAVDAVWPFFGQFVAHDISADRSPLDPAHRPDEITNFRAPRADLESLYGSGPTGAPSTPLRLYVLREAEVLGTATSRSQTSCCPAHTSHRKERSDEADTQRRSVPA